MSRKFCIFILSHGRADNVKTIKTLKKYNYSGDIKIIIDNTDKNQERYQELYGDMVYVFDKYKAAETTDTLDNFGKMNIVVYARNTCHEIAKELGYTHFLVLDDDYTSFVNRYEEKGVLKSVDVSRFDNICEIYCDFLDESGALTVAFAQGGDFIGGKGSSVWTQGVLRKAMNAFFMRTDRPFKYMGTTNEDCNAYCLLGSRGGLFFTTRDVMLNQTETQRNSGGLTDIYLEQGTYVKSFYSLMVMPSAVSIRPMGNKHMRLHHNVNWNKCVPKILDEKYKK